jgi:hypothetical protein
MTSAMGDSASNYGDEENADCGRSDPHSLNSNNSIKLLLALRVSKLVCVITQDTPALSDYRPGRRGCRISL